MKNYIRYVLCAMIFDLFSKNTFYIKKPNLIFYLHYKLTTKDYHIIDKQITIYIYY